MEAAEHREPCESRGSCTDLGAPGGEIPPGDSTFTSVPPSRRVRFAPSADIRPKPAFMSTRPSYTATPNTAHRRRTMKGVVFLGDRKLELRRFPDPTPGPRDVILAIKASGMCGSDLHTYRAPANPGGVVTGGIKRAAGVIAGHEPCGVVAAVGTAVTDREARIGQRVMDHHYD